MFLRLTSYITVGSLIYDRLCEVEVNSSWENFTDTARVVLPSKLKFKQQQIVSGSNPLIRKGDPVKIELGYGFDFNTVFQGYVSAIKIDNEITIECEDAMWLLKQRLIEKASYKTVQLKQLLTDILPPGFAFEAAAIGLGQFRVSKSTVVQILDELKKTYGIYSWCRADEWGQNKLYCGVPVFEAQAQAGKSKRFHFQENVTDSSNLNYLRKDDVKIKVKCISIMPNNDKIEVEAGDPEGEQRTLHYYNRTLEDLKQTAKTESERLRFEGYRGDFTAIGQPFVRHGEAVQLFDDRFPDRAGRYTVKSVNYKFGTTFRQTIAIDKKL